MFNKNYKCPSCGEFISFWSLKWLLKNRLKISKQYYCKYCNARIDWVFGQKNRRLSEHLFSHLSLCVAPLAISTSYMGILLSLIAVISLWGYYYYNLRPLLSENVPEITFDPQDLISTKIINTVHKYGRIVLYLPVSILITIFLLMFMLSFTGYARVGEGFGFKFVVIAGLFVFWCIMQIHPHVYPLTFTFKRYHSVFYWLIVGALTVFAADLGTQVVDLKLASPYQSAYILEKSNNDQQVWKPINETPELDIWKFEKQKWRYREKGVEASLELRKGPFGLYHIQKSQLISGRTPFG